MNHRGDDDNMKPPPMTTDSTSSVVASNVGWDDGLDEIEIDDSKLKTVIDGMVDAGNNDLQQNVIPTLDDQSLLSSVSIEVGLKKDVPDTIIGLPLIRCCCFFGCFCRKEALRHCRK